MLDTKTLCTLITGIGQNMAFNLDFIPADKLSWKPAPTANSALEIVNHVLGALGSLTGSTHPAPVADVASAKRELTEEIARFTSKLSAASPEELAAPMGSYGLSLGQLAALLVADTINHHGQITYIQTLLGDTDSHFAPGVVEALA